MLGSGRSLLFDSVESTSVVLSLRKFLGQQL
jgi:hypothetical protein